jgi:hypothetical protein
MARDRCSGQWARRILTRPDSRARVVSSSRVDHLAIRRDPGVGDDRLDLVACEHRVVAPLGILFDERPELALVEDAGRLLDQVGELRVPEQGRDHREDV